MFFFILLKTLKIVGTPNRSVRPEEAFRHRNTSFKFRYQTTEVRQSGRKEYFFFLFDKSLDKEPRSEAFTSSSSRRSDEGRAVVFFWPIFLSAELSPTAAGAQIA